MMRIQTGSLHGLLALLLPHGALAGCGHAALVVISDAGGIAAAKTWYVDSSRSDIAGQMRDEHSIPMVADLTRADGVLRIAQTATCICGGVGFLEATLLDKTGRTLGRVGMWDREHRRDDEFGAFCARTLARIITGKYLLLPWFLVSDPAPPGRSEPVAVPHIDEQVMEYLRVRSRNGS